MGINVLSLFDGMSCGHLALDAAGVSVDSYIASEVKPFAVRHTKSKYPETIEALDVTALHYETGGLYKGCKRWCVVKNLSLLRPEDYERNKDIVKEDGAITYMDVTRMEFPDLGSSKKTDLPFDRKNEVLAKYKDAGLFLNAKDMDDERVDNYIALGHEVLPNGEIVKWELGEEILRGGIDLLIGGSPCTNFSVACSPHHKAYGLEGPKSRLFFDYLRLLNETNPRYFFFENVKMREESRKTLDEYLGVSGVEVNSRDFSFQNRVRLYWTNIEGGAPSPCDPSNEKLNFQSRKLRTIQRMEWALYVAKFPGSYFGYTPGTPEHTKEAAGAGKFTFDDCRTDETNRILSGGGTLQVEGTKEDIGRLVTFTSMRYDEQDGALGQTAKHARLDLALVPDLSFTDEEAAEIARMNAWARPGYEALIGRAVTNREFADEIHNQLFEALATKSPSRDSMRYGRTDGSIFSSPCADVTDSEKVGCLTRKQDRLPNAGNIAFGPYYRFLTKFELCEAQTVPYEFLGDLSYGEVQDVCGDGWTVDVVAGFFSHIEGESGAYNSSKEYVATESCSEKIEVATSMSSRKVQEKELKDEKTVDGLRTIPRGFYKTTAIQVSVPDDDAAILAMREALRPWEAGFTGELHTGEANCKEVAEVLSVVERVLGKEAADRVRYELCGFDIESTPKCEAPAFVVDAIKAEVTQGLKSGNMTDDLTKKALWLMD